MITNRRDQGAQYKTSDGDGALNAKEPSARGPLKQNNYVYLKEFNHSMPHPIIQKAPPQSGRR